jgi:hypothetical protein
MASADQRTSLAFMLSIAGQVLLVSYAVAVATSIVPAQPTSPAWQLNLVTSLVDNGGLALIGLLLIHGAALIDQRNAPLQARRQRLAHLAVLAAFGFVFTIPVLVVASVQYRDQMRSERVGRIERATLRLEHLSERVAAAASHKDISTALLDFRGQGLPQEELSKPLPEVRTSLLAQLQQARSRMEAQLPPPGVIEAGPLLQSGLRLGITALAYALGFLAAGRRPGSAISMLEEIRALDQKRREAASERREMRAAFLRSLEEARLEQDLVGEQAPAPAAPAVAAPENPTAVSPPGRGRPVDFDYFDQISRGEDDAAPPPPSAS